MDCLIMTNLVMKRLVIKSLVMTGLFIKSLFMKNGAVFFIRITTGALLAKDRGLADFLRLQCRLNQPIPIRN